MQNKSSFATSLLHWGHRCTWTSSATAVPGSHEFLRAAPHNMQNFASGSRSRPHSGHCESRRSSSARRRSASARASSSALANASFSSSLSFARVRSLRAVSSVNLLRDRISSSHFSFTSSLSDSSSYTRAPNAALASCCMQAMFSSCFTTTARFESNSLFIFDKSNSGMVALLFIRVLSSHCHFMRARCLEVPSGLSESYLLSRDQRPRSPFSIDTRQSCRSLPQAVKPRRTE